ncbi:MAG: metalloregulator ArsR/SmtB family transcription factor [Lentisphaerae bacterium]|jgi:DNA-binding transcriptional ArsR family regulator|nr:metalloregulator ArsR/SmtB family transcription factor [Lentisphaerota bacterium]
MKTTNRDLLVNCYHPTLWRTCRVLANECRLQCLREVVTTPGLCVTEIAQAVGISISDTSFHLRLLQSRGLIIARRVGRWVYYSPVADPLVPSAAPLLEVMSHLFLQGEALPHIMKQVTAYTHPRRLQILRLVQQKSPLTVLTIARRCNISLPATYRHIHKLITRRLIGYNDDIVTFLPPSQPIHQVMLRLISKSL